LSGLVLRPVELSDAGALHAIFAELGVQRYLFDDCLLSREETLTTYEARPRSA
jgi:hypothetical protein